MDQPELQMRKLEKLQEIRLRYGQRKGLLSKLFATKYYSTEIAASEQVDFRKVKGHEIRYSAGSSFVNAGFLLFVQMVLFFSANSTERKHFTFITFQILGTLSVIYFLYRQFSRQVALRMNHEGIEDSIGEKTYRWDDILATHLYDSYTGKTTRTYLTLDYYDKVKDTFKSKEIDITDFDLSVESIASYIESYKRLRKDSA
jgi:hypothetical protein